MHYLHRQAQLHRLGIHQYFSFWLVDAVAACADVTLYAHRYAYQSVKGAKAARVSVNHVGTPNLSHTPALVSRFKM